jgi:VWFA-related protein
MSGLEASIAQKTPQTKKSYFLFALFLFGSVLGPAIGQMPSSLEQTVQKPDQAQTITSNVDEVSLDLLVHDKKHKLIADLKPEDIVVTDNGTPVKLNDFRFVKGDNARGHMVTLVFDRFTGPTANSARSAAQKILDVLPSNGYSLAVLDFAGRMRLLQGFTQDRKLIEQAVEAATESQASALESTRTLAVSIVTDKAEPARAAKAAETEKEIVSVARTGVDSMGRHVEPAERAKAQILVTALQDAQQIAMDQHASRSLSGLLALVKAQQKAGARKAIIYFTQNRQMDSAQKEMVKNLSAAATKAGVSIYTVDFDALNESGQYQLDNAMANGKPPFNPAPQEVPGSGGHAMQIPMQQQSAEPIGSQPGYNWTSKDDIAVMTDFHRRSNDYAMFAYRNSPMAELANDSGGAYIDAQNSLKKPLQQMVEDLTTYYEASYVPPLNEYDGTFHAIEIKPLREGLRIQSKTGYYAAAPGAEAGARPFEAPVMKLLSEPDARTDVRFHAAVLHFGEMSDGNTSTVAVEVPIDAIETRKDVHTNLFSAHVSIVAQIKDKTGTVIEHFAEDISRRGALEIIDRDKSGTISLQRHFLASPGQYTLEVAVLDRFNDKAGVQRINFEVPAVQASPSVSDVVLVRKVDAFEEGDDPQEPMRFDKGRITPNLSGDVSQDAKSVSLFFILHPDTQSKDPVTLEMEASRNGHPGRRIPLALHLDAAQMAVPYLASFKSGLAPGDYEVKAILNQGEKSSIQRVSFTVEGDQPASSEAAANIAPDRHGEASATTDVMPSGPVAPSSSPLVITAITNPVTSPSQDEIKQLIADARERALHYVDSLPNFMCIEVTSRSVDSTGQGRWKLRDTISELLSYRDKAETRTMLEVNGKAESASREGMKGAFSAGELGGVLRAVFQESAKADFEWKETDTLGTGTVQVFNYRVGQSNSVFSVVGRNDKQIIVGFHGQIYIDTATRNVRRITLIADDLPHDFPTHYTSIAVDYEYVAINAHDYLMPISAELRLLQGRHEAVLNSIEFRNYRRFGSNMRIVSEPIPAEKP